MNCRIWALQIGWKHHIVETAYGEGFGSIRLDGVLMERWIRRDSVECHRVIIVKGHRLGLHLYKSSVEGCDWDLSLNGISIETGEQMNPILPSPSEGIWKRWHLRLESGLHILCLEHRLHVRKTLYLDGKIMLAVRCEIEGDSDHLFQFKGCRIGVHLRQVEKNGFLYHVTVDGAPQEAGQLSDSIAGAG